MLKEVEQGGLVAWNFQTQNQHCFATASIQPNENNQFVLQIFQFDILDKQKRPKEIGFFEIGKPTRSICWSTFGTEHGYNYGIILLGLEDSSILMIDAEAALFACQQQKQPVIHQEFEIFENLGPIESLAYNTLKPNLIAIGGEEVLIMDIQINQNQIDPILFSPDADNNPHNNSTVTAVSWNQKLSHILASASQNGITVIWDLKSNKPIKSFGGDSLRTITEDVCLGWSPVNPTCVAKTEEDSKSQEVQIWDLRNPKGPIMILEKCEKGGHNGHISSISWCTTDSSLVLTGGHDQKVICWSIKDQTPISIEEFDEQIKDVSWSQINNLYSVTLMSGKVILKSLNNDESSIAPPRWYVPPVGARFSAQRDISTFHESVQNVRIHTKEEQSSNTAFLDFDEFFEQQSNIDHIGGICDWKLKEGKYHQKDHQVWKLLKAISFNDNYQILETLGFNRQDIQKKAERYTGKTHKIANEDSNADANAVISKKKKVEHTSAITEIDEQGAMDFFDELAQESQKPKEQPRDRATSNMKRLSSSAIDKDEVFVEETISKNINWDAGIERIIKENLIISNYEGAIDSAMKCGRTAEALLLAYSQGSEVFENTMKDYFVGNTDPFIKNVLRNIVKKNNSEMVQVYNLDHWRECIGLLINSVQNKEELKGLINALGERFLSEQKDEDNAILCFIISQNFSKLAEIYHERVATLRINSLERKQAIVRYLEILIVLNQLLQDSQESNLFFNQMIFEVSRYLYDEQLVVASYSVLLEADEKNAKIANFKDLLYRAFATKLSPYYDPPAQPYKVQNIRIVQRQQPQQQQKKQPMGGFQGQKSGPTARPTNQFNQPPTGNQFNKPQPPSTNTGNQFNRPPVNNNIAPPVNNNNTRTAGGNPFGGNNMANNQVPPVNNQQTQPPVHHQPSGNQFQQQQQNKQAPPPVAKKEHKPVGGPKVAPPSFQKKPVGNPNAFNNNKQQGGFGSNNAFDQQQQHNQNQGHVPPPVHHQPPQPPVAAPPKNKMAPPPGPPSAGNNMAPPPMGGANKGRTGGGAAIPPPPMRR